ncbi:hypothetical protein [Desulfovibrio aminophilus]|uniref:hypothetical protein n=1 Tax=Desulfovibrio aminophilus TaxID=81425 RepID=UPI0033911651
MGTNTYHNENIDDLISAVSPGTELFVPVDQGINAGTPRQAMWRGGVGEKNQEESWIKDSLEKNRNCLFRSGIYRNKEFRINSGDSRRPLVDGAFRKICMRLDETMRRAYAGQVLRSRSGRLKPY